MPRKHRTPQRLTHGCAPEHQFSGPEEYFTGQYFCALDAAKLHLKEYFSSNDLDTYKELANILLQGSYPEDLVCKYPELRQGLREECRFFRTQFSGGTLEDFRSAFVSMVPEVRQMFPRVEGLLRLLLTSPASSCEAERSYSVLRRLKTWLRSTMRQDRLNHLMMCHVHQDRLDGLDAEDIAKEFVSRCPDVRKKVFG